MKQCQFCNASFADEDAYQIHLGVGAPAFHSCNDADDMKAKGMQLHNGLWNIDKSLIFRRENWAYLVAGYPKRGE
jgi:hypothetical protein